MTRVREGGKGETEDHGPGQRPQPGQSGEACIPVTSTIINTFGGNAADIYSVWRLTILRLGQRDTHRPVVNDDVTVLIIVYEGSSKNIVWNGMIYCRFGRSPVAELVDDIGDLSDLRSSALLTHRAIRSLMGKGQMDSVVYLLEQLNSDYDLPYCSTSWSKRS